LDLSTSTDGHSWKIKKARFNTDLRQHFCSVPEHTDFAHKYFTR